MARNVVGVTTQPISATHYDLYGLRTRMVRQRCAALAPVGELRIRYRPRSHQPTPGHPSCVYSRYPNIACGAGASFVSDTHHVTLRITLQESMQRATALSGVTYKELWRPSLPNLNKVANSPWKWFLMPRCRTSAFSRPHKSMDYSDRVIMATLHWNWTPARRLQRRSTDIGVSPRKPASASGALWHCIICEHW